GVTVNGDVRYRTAPFTGVVLNGGTATQGDPPNGLDFDKEFTDLAALSDHLATLPTTTGANVVLQPWGALEFTGATASLNVINVDGSQLASAAGVTISAPAGTLVINVTAPPTGQLTVPLGYMNPPSGGITNRQVLWNFIGVTTFTFTGNG